MYDNRTGPAPRSTQEREAEMNAGARTLNGHLKELETRAVGLRGGLDHKSGALAICDALDDLADDLHACRRALYELTAERSERSTPRLTSSCGVAVSSRPAIVIHGSIGRSSRISSTVGSSRKI